MYIITTVVSSIEFHRNMSLVIFMAKCPLKCRYCSNKEAFDVDEEMTFEEVKEIIDTNADFMDAVVVSGGEPLVQLDDVIDILTYVRTLGLKTKLDTSGVYPERIQKLLDLNLLDFVSLDVKAPFDKYKPITGSDVGLKVKESMELISEDENVILETRTTYCPVLLSEEEVIEIASNVKSDIYTIQQFRNRCVLDESLATAEEPNPHDLRALAKKVKPHFDGIIKVKSAEFGEQTIEE